MRKKDIVEITTKGLISLIPYLGGTITSVWSDIQAERKRERLLQFYSELDNEVMLINERLNNDYISKADFLDVFETTVKFVINERSDDKRQMFKNILLNGMTDKISDFDKTEKYLRLVDEMGSLEFLLLKIFLNPVNFIDDHNGIIKEPKWISSNVRNTMTVTKTYSNIQLLVDLLLKVEKEDIEDALNLLERNRLVKRGNFTSYVESSGRSIDLLKDKLTEKGKDFVLYILKKEDQLADN